MAEFKVDSVHYHYSKTSGKLEVWCFNDDKAYSAKNKKLVARYDFGRKLNTESGSNADKKQKLIVGLYREPYMDGWKYTIHSKVLPELAKTVWRYIYFGFQLNEDGEIEPFTYLRHNRKALGIHYLLERYVKFFKEVLEENIRHHTFKAQRYRLKTAFPPTIPLGFGMPPLFDYCASRKIKKSPEGEVF